MVDTLIVKSLIESAKETYPESPLLAKLVSTQGLLESGYTSKRAGSSLARRHNNLFGIKGEGTAGSVTYKTTEYIKGSKVVVDAKFASYKTHQDCYKAHKKIISLKRYTKVREATTIEECFNQIYKCGYATDPKYPQKLLEIYEQYVIPNWP